MYVCFHDYQFSSFLCLSLYPFLLSPSPLSLPPPSPSLSPYTLPPLSLPLISPYHLSSLSPSPLPLPLSLYPPSSLPSPHPSLSPVLPLSLTSLTSLSPFLVYSHVKYFMTTHNLASLQSNRSLLIIINYM